MGMILVLLSVPSIINFYATKFLVPVCLALDWTVNYLCLLVCWWFGNLEGSVFYWRCVF